MNFNTVPCLFAADVMGGGVTTCTRVSGEMVKPSMYNCLTLIKGGCRGGGDGSLGAKSPVSKPFGGVARGWGCQLLEAVGMQVCEPTCSRPDFQH